MVVNARLSQAILVTQMVDGMLRLNLLLMLMLTLLVQVVNKPMS